MHVRVMTVAMALAAVSCGGGHSQSADAAATAGVAAQPVTDVPPIGQPIIDTRPTWEGFAATRTASVGLAAYAIDDLDIFVNPDATKPILTLDRTTILGTVTVLGVIGDPTGEWLKVMLPTRPNGSTGWVRAADVALYVADSQVVVDLSDRRLSYYVDGVEVLATEIGVGSVHNPTPTGMFFVTDSVTLTDPHSPWGPHALGLSARSETITEFNGGDGIIGIHGTNNPSSIGGNISLGCLRLPNEMITALHEMVPIGTRVEIKA